MRLMLIWMAVAGGLTVFWVVLLGSMKRQTHHNPDAVPANLKRFLEAEPWGTVVFFTVTVLLDLVVGCLQHPGK